jgi:hypothetical protein
MAHSTGTHTSSDPPEAPPALMRYQPVVLAVAEAMIARMGTTEAANAAFSVRVEGAASFEDNYVMIRSPLAAWTHAGSGGPCGSTT